MNQHTNEQWRDVPGTDSHYQVSNLGRVKSVARTIINKNGKQQSFPERLLKPSPDKDGYSTLSVRKNGKFSTVRIHVLVLTCFDRPPQPGEITRHLNGIRTDNRIDNLKWGTQMENMRDRIDHGHNPELNKTRCNRGHLLIEPNLEKYQLKSGHRKCSACARAFTHTRRNPHLAGELQAVADSYYRKLMA